MANDTTPAHRVRVADLSPELRAKLAERRVKAITNRHLEGPPPNVTGEPIFFYHSFRSAILALRQAREAAGLSVADAAATCGASDDEITRLEAGAFLNPTWKLLGDYAHAVGVKLTLSVEPNG